MLQDAEQEAWRGAGDLVTQLLTSSTSSQTHMQRSEAQIPGTIAEWQDIHQTKTYHPATLMTSGSSGIQEPRPVPLYSGRTEGGGGKARSAVARPDLAKLCACASRCATSLSSSCSLSCITHSTVHLPQSSTPCAETGFHDCSKHNTIMRRILH